MLMHSQSAHRVCVADSIRALARCKLHHTVNSLSNGPVGEVHKPVRKLPVVGWLSLPISRIIMGSTVNR